MKPKFVLIIGIMMVVSAALAYYWTQRSQPPASPVQAATATSGDKLPVTEDQLQKGLQEMITKKAEKKSLQTQLAVYEKLSQKLPANKELQHRVEALRQRLRELE